MEQTMHNPQTARVQIKHPNLAMISMMIGAFVGMLSETSLNIALPKLMISLNVTTATIQWLVTGYMLMVGLVLPFSSFLTKWFTTRQLIIFGLLDFITGAVIAALAVNFPILLIGRMIQGIATGLILPLMFTVAMQIFPPYRLGAAMGICALVIMLAPALGPTLTGLILAKLSWHWIFWLFVPILVVALIFAITSLKNVSQLTKPKLDITSLCLSIVGFGAVVMGVSFASELGWASPVVLGMLVIGTVSLAFYARRQLKLAVPILNLKAFKLNGFRTGTAIVMLDFGIILSAMYLLPMEIQKGMDLPVAMTGLIMLPGGIVNALVSAMAGRLYDNFGAKWPARFGLVIAAIGTILLININQDSSIAALIFAHVVLMIGCPLAMSPAQTYGLNSLTGRLAADGSTIMNTLQQIVGAIATAIATSLLQIGQTGTHQSATVAFTNGAHLGFYFTLVLTIIGVVITFWLKPTPNN